MTLTPASMVLHDQQSHVALHFDYLDLTSAVVPLMMPLTSDAAAADGNDITCP